MLKDNKAGTGKGSGGRFHLSREDWNENIVRLWVVMIFVFILMSILSPGLFPTVNNLSSMLFQIPEFGLLSIAMMIVLVSGGLDLSVVGAANLSSVIAALVLINIPENSNAAQTLGFSALAITAAVGTGLSCGIINGLLITRVKITPILTTLGTMQLFTGLALVLTKGSPFYGFPESILEIGNGSIGVVPYSFILFVLAAVIVSVLLAKSSFGIKLYMLGTNPLASRFSGINNNTVLIQVYAVSGVLSALAGLIMMARTNSANADYGTSYTLQTLLVSVMGGVSPDGGYGKLAGVLLSIFTLQFLSSGFNILHVNNLFRGFIWGAVLILVVVMDYYSEKRRAKTRAL